VSVVDPSGAFLLILLLWVGIGGGVGALIGSQRGRGGTGFLLGLVLGVIGWVIILLIAPAAGHQASQLVVATRPLIGGGEMYRECTRCREPMRRDASLCPHCRSEAEPWTFHDGRWWVTRGSGSYWLDPHTQHWVRYEAPPAPPSPAAATPDA
jgi:hypothetical protein